MKVSDNMKICPECRSTDVKDSAFSCPYCGYQFMERSKPEIKSEPPIFSDDERTNGLNSGGMEGGYDNNYSSYGKNKSGIIKKIFLVLVCILLILLILIVIVSFEDDGSNSTNNTNTNNTQNQVQTQATTVAQTTATPQKEVSAEEQRMINIMRGLMDCNVEVLDMFYFGNHLETTNTTVGTNLLQVKSDKFKTYTEFRYYIESVYESEYAFEKFINPCRYMPGSGDSLGMNIIYGTQGERDYVTEYDAIGYFVDWSGYILNIESYSSSECIFTVVGRDNSSAGVGNEYVRQGKAVYKNGRWGLTSVIY